MKMFVFRIVFAKLMAAALALGTYGRASAVDQCCAAKGVSKCDRLQSYIHNLAAKDGRYVAEFNLGRSRTKACAPVTFRWRGEAGTQYAVSVNGHALGVVSGETCAVVAEAAHVGRDPNRLSIDVVAGCDTALTNENRIAVFITVPAEKGPRLSEREFLEHLALPIDTSDVQEGARQFVRYVRENYRIEPEIRETQTRRLTGNDRCARRRSRRSVPCGLRRIPPTRSSNSNFPMAASLRFRSEGALMLLR